MAHRRLTRVEARALTVRRLLASAQEVFQEKGYAAASVAEIAERAGYSKGAVYANFAGKEALFLAVNEQRNTAWRDDLLAAMEAAGTAAEFVRRVGTWQRQSLARNVNRIQLDGEFWLLAERNPEWRLLVAEGFTTGTLGVTQMVQSQVDRFSLRPSVTALDAARLLVAVVYGVQTQARFDPDVAEYDLLALALALVMGIDPAAVRPDAEHGAGDHQ